MLSAAVNLLDMEESREMSYFEWSDEYALGIEEFDMQHKELVALLNRTYDLYRDVTPVERLNQIIEELVDYATYHFATEEYWMQEKGYPGFDEHVRQHEDFSCRIVGFELDHADGKENLVGPLLTFLKEWLAEHMLQSDYKYAVFAGTR